MSHLQNIQRNFRIQPSATLIDFWKTIAKKELHKGWTSYKFFKFKLLTLQEVAEYPTKDIRFWFRLRPKINLIRYYIPIAQSFSGSGDVFVMGYDSAKHFVGIFLCNLEIDPVFISDDLNEFTAGIAPATNALEFLQENVSKGILMEFPLPASHFDEVVDYREMETAAQKLKTVFDFLEKIFPLFHYQEKLNITETETSFEIAFEKVSDPVSAVTPKILLKKAEFYDNDTFIPLLNLINYQMQNSHSNMIAEYGFYRFHDGIVVLQREQLIEFVRNGSIPIRGNVHLPSIIHSTKASGYKNKQEYEVLLFETEEEYQQYVNNYTSAPLKIIIRETIVKDIPKLADYFLNSSIPQLAMDGIDALKIPSEEILSEQLETILESPSNTYLLSYKIDKKLEGHCHFDQIIPSEQAIFYFYYWYKSYNREAIIDEFITESVANIKEAFQVNTIYAPIPATDHYRREALKRTGFTQTDDPKIDLHEMGTEQPVEWWALTL